MNKSWKPIFLFGQARHPSANKYLVNDAAKLTRRSCTRKPDRLLLRSYVEGSYGLWFCFTLEGSWWSLYQTLHSDSSVKRFTTPKSNLYLGNCSSKREYPRREGKLALSYRAVAKIVLKFSICFISLPCTNFCRSIWYRSRLKLEDVSMGLLAKRFGVTPRRHRGFMTDSLNGRFFSVQA